MKKWKRVLAWVGIVLLAGLYGATLVSAVLATPATFDLFMTSLVATVMIPIILYVLQMIYRWIGNRTEEE